MKHVLSGLGEKKLLHTIRKYLGKTTGIVRTFSEDCAVIDSEDGNYMLLTMDVQLENVHFRLKYMPPFYLGKRALKVNLSDISAMGGRPLYYLVSLGAPPSTPLETIQGIYRGMKSAAQKHGICLIGGNITQSPLLFLDITMMGTVRRGEVLFRSGARRGDLIYVTGPLGGSAAGLRLLQKGFRLQRKNAKPVQQAILSHLDPPDLNSFARKLAASGLAHSMIDLSDGLGPDLSEICRESKVGAVVELQNVPVVESVRSRKGKRNVNPVELALQGGEDYHLLFTVSPKNSARLLRLAAKNRTKLFGIGRIVHASEGIHSIDSKGIRRPLGGGYEHFK